MSPFGWVGDVFMKYEDLYRFPEGHPPSPYERPVVVFNVGEVYLPAGLHLLAVGWIEEAGFATGAVPEEFLAALVAAYPAKVVPDGTRGLHTCTLCHVIMPKVEWKGKKIDVKGYGHFLIRYEKAVYMAPALVLHYVLDHNYRPPQIFIDAVAEGKFLTTADLEIKQHG
jgi:hypothetical protein